MDKEQARQIARIAVEKLAEDRGGNTRFPFDAIWQYAGELLPPSTLRPGCSAVLIREGYVEKTGALTNAESEARAGSNTPEYRLGFRFRPTLPALPTGPLVLSDAIRNLQAAMAAKGFIISAAEIANFYLALAASPLIILAGISGTGKSKLPRLFAQLTGSEFYPIPVKPQWSDNSDLFGYTPSLNPIEYIEGPFTKATREAAVTLDKLHLVLLDEMNLAAVEHYFSDFLSVVETRRREEEAVITDRLPLDLPPMKDNDPHAHLRDLRLPRNTRVVGTANMDETTHSFSPKVLDRAFSIEFDEPDLTIFSAVAVGQVNEGAIPPLVTSLLDNSNPVSVNEVYSTASGLFDCIAALLEEVKAILKPAGISFGYRPRNDICLYMYFWEKFKLGSVLSATAAMDFCFLQKILPKINGTGEALGDALEALQRWLEEKEVDDTTDPNAITPCTSRPWARSAEKVQRMRNRLEVESATTYWGT